MAEIGVPTDTSAHRKPHTSVSRVTDKLYDKMHRTKQGNTSTIEAIFLYSESEWGQMV